MPVKQRNVPSMVAIINPSSVRSSIPSPGLNTEPDTPPREDIEGKRSASILSAGIPNWERENEVYYWTHSTSRTKSNETMKQLNVTTNDIVSLSRLIVSVFLIGLAILFIMDLTIDYPEMMKR